MGILLVNPHQYVGRANLPKIDRKESEDIFWFSSRVFQCVLPYFVSGTAAQCGGWAASFCVRGGFGGWAGDDFGRGEEARDGALRRFRWRMSW
ncbi:MAG: hypothetical protein R2724_07065 [Bryobacterales bacterium]